VEERLCEAGAVAVSFRKCGDGLVGYIFEKTGLDGVGDGFFLFFSFDAPHGGAELEEVTDCHFIVERGRFREVA